MIWPKRLFSIKSKRKRSSRVQACNLVKPIAGETVSSENIIFNLIDISEQGLQLSSSKRLNPGEVLHLLINPALREISISISAKVIWVRKIRNKNSCRAGLSFVKLTQSSRAAIDAYMLERQKKRSKFSFL